MSFWGLSEDGTNYSSLLVAKGPREPNTNTSNVIILFYRTLSKGSTYCLELFHGHCHCLPLSPQSMFQLQFMMESIPCIIATLWPWQPWSDGASCWQIALLASPNQVFP